MSTTYRWKPASHVKIDAQLAGEELERIKAAHNGRLDQEDIVDAARDEANPLHEHFEWDDATAAEAYRLDQAGHLIRTIEIIHERPDQEPTPIRAFVSVAQQEERFYVSTTDAMADPELRRQVINQAWRELEAWRCRHAELTEFGKIFSEIDQARGAL